MLFFTDSEGSVGINYATTEYGAKTIHGRNPLALLNSNYENCSPEQGNTLFYLFLISLNNIK